MCCAVSICSAFVYVHVFSWVTVRWAISATTVFFIYLFNQEWSLIKILKKKKRVLVTQAAKQLHGYRHRTNIIRTIKATTRNQLLSHKIRHIPSINITNIYSQMSLLPSYLETLWMFSVRSVHEDFTPFLLLQNCLSSVKRHHEQIFCTDVMLPVWEDVFLLMCWHAV